MSEEPVSRETLSRGAEPREAESREAEPREAETTTGEPRDAAPLALSAFVLLGAFLLFTLEPLVGRVLLPRFGGAFHVWTTSLMFFQGVLVLAYAYAHLLAKRLGRWHFAVLAAPLLFFPIGAAPLEGALGGHAPEESVSIGALLLALTRTCAVPFFALATTSVLAQDWLVRAARARHTNAYVLYAVSNVGSLTALFAYALIVEPVLGLRLQGWLYTGAYGLYLLSAIAAYTTLRPRAPTPTPTAPDAKGPATALPALDARTQLSWVSLSAWPSALLMAVTNVVTVDAGNVPLLWILPLAVYLITFILAFSDAAQTPNWVRRLWPHFAVVGTFFFVGQTAGSPVFHVALQLGVLLIVSWAAHAALYASRPAPAHLTRFYLLVALGGWLGGAFVALVAPFVFSGLWEYPVALAGLALTMAASHWDELRPWARGPGKLPLLATLALLGVVAWRLLDGMGPSADGMRIVATARSPYGRYHVVERPSPSGPVRDLVSGETRHGRQVIEGPLRREPLSYYHREGPLGDVMAILTARPMTSTGTRPALSIGAIGLGVGAIAAYLAPQDTLDLYEIDALDVSLAREHFHFLGDAQGTVHMHVGDGRLTLERQAREGQRHRFDLLLLDAFAGDAIPTHLLTREALEGYVGQLAEGGVLLVHISNRFYELRPVLQRAADSLGLGMAWKQRVASEVARGEGVALEDPSMYVALWPQDMGNRWWHLLEARGWQRFVLGDDEAPVLFTDDYAPALRALRGLGH